LSSELIDEDHVSRNRADTGRSRLGVLVGLSNNQEAREYIRILEELLGVPEIDDLLDPGFLSKELA
jgi:hypothetical protein